MITPLTKIMGVPDALIVALNTRLRQIGVLQGGGSPTPGGGSGGGSPAPLVPPAPNVASATATVATVVVGGVSYYQFSGTFVNAPDTTDVASVAVVMENITGAPFDVPVQTFFAPLVAGATVSWVSALIPTPTAGGTQTFTPAFRSSNLIGVVTSPEVNTGNLTVAVLSVPNITSSTVTENYVLIGNNWQWYLTGTITMPAGSAAIASVAIAIVGLDTSAVTLNAPGGGFGATVAWRTPNYNLPLAPVTYTLDFTSVSATGAATAGPYSTTATITPTTVNSLAIAEVSGARQIQPGNQSTTISVTPTFANLNGLQNLTFWFSRDGGSTLYWLAWYPFYPGTQTVIDVGVQIVSTALSGGLPANNFILYAVVGAQTAPGSAAAPINYATLHTAFPSVVTSNAISLLPGAPKANGGSMSVWNSHSVSATPANVYMGYNDLGNPWFDVVIAVQTPGGNNSGDPNTLYYSVCCAWTDASGNLISPGGVSNTPGWIQFAPLIPNVGTGVTLCPLWANYPAPGVTAYMSFAVFALNQDLGTVGSTFPTPPGPNYFYPSASPQQFTLAGFPRIFTLGPMTNSFGTVAGGLSNQAALNNPTGALQQATNNGGTSLLPDWQFAYDALGALGANGQTNWTWFTGPPVATVTPSVSVANDGGSSTAGVANYCVLTGALAIVQNILDIPMSGAFYFAFSARSNSPSLGVVSYIASTPVSPSGYTPGTYTGVALNGAGGTGATATVTIVTGNLLSGLVITAIGSGYTPGSTFNVACPGGGTGITLNVSTGVSQVSLSVTAYNSTTGTVAINGNTTNFFNVTGPQSSWEIVAASGTLLMPANVNYVVIQVSSHHASVPTQAWDVTNIQVQVVQNQVNNAQTNSQVPSAQLSGYTLASAESVATTAAATYGLSHMQLLGTASEGIDGDINPGLASSFGVTADSGQVAVTMGAQNNPSGGCFLLLANGSDQISLSISSSGIELNFVGATPQVSVNGHLGFTGAVAGRSAIAGFVI